MTDAERAQLHIAHLMSVAGRALALASDAIREAAALAGELAEADQ